MSRQRVEPAAAVFALVDDLNSIGADRLRICALGERGGPQCDTIFLSKRRQLFCTPRHAQAAAWIKYEPTRKEQRA